MGTYLLMYSPVSAQPQVRHLKQLTCHCLSRASRDWPCLISSPQPAQSGGEEMQHRGNTSRTWEQLQHFKHRCIYYPPSPSSLSPFLCCESRTVFARWSHQNQVIRLPGAAGHLLCMCVWVCSCRGWGYVLQRSAGGQQKYFNVFFSPVGGRILFHVGWIMKTWEIFIKYQ